MKAELSPENIKETDIHHRARLEGGAVFHHRWTFKYDVSPQYTACSTILRLAHRNANHLSASVSAILRSHVFFRVDSPLTAKARLAFPELKIQLRSVRKEAERVQKAREDIATAKVDNSPFHPFLCEFAISSDLPVRFSEPPPRARSSRIIDPP